FYCYSLILFFICLLRSPISTLFPYTTLFRSKIIKVLTDSNVFLHQLRGNGLTGGDDLGEFVEFVFDFTEVVTQKLHQHQCRFGKDRKSTRLNSSHVKISYAVFCLKKKKKQ